MAESTPLKIARTNEPFFIVGAGRSGTTLLRSVLSAHSRLAVTPETHFMVRADREGLTDGEPEDFDDFWRRLTGWVRFQDLGIDPGQCRERIEASGDRSFRSVFRIALETYSDRTGKPRIGEKTPSHVLYLDRLFRWFPRAQVIAIRRDPRSVVASQIQTPQVEAKRTRRSFRTGLFAFKRINQIIAYANDWRNIYAVELPRWSNDPRVLLVSYERLVSDPGGELRKICDFLGEEFEPNMIADRDNINIPGAAGTMPDEKQESWRRGHENRARQPIDDTSLFKWRRDLSRFEVAVIERCCGNTMTAASYRFDTGRMRQMASHGIAHLHLGLANLEGASRAAARRLLRRDH